MTNKKKILSLLLIASNLVFLFACGAKGGLQSAKKDPNTTNNTLENTFDNAKNNTEYMVLLGEDSSSIDSIKNVDVLVIDAAYFTEEDILTLKENGVEKIYTYLNIGSIESFRDFYDDFEKYTLGDYENWPDEKWIDVSKEEWQKQVQSECTALEKKGIDGFFIDNVDVYYVYPKDEIYAGIVEILSNIKNTGKPVIINGGDFFVKKYIESKDERMIFDGVNQEDVYTTYDFSTNTYKKNDNDELLYFTEYLDMVNENGYEVYVLEYANESDLVNEAYSYSKDKKYFCYVADNIELKCNSL